MGTLRMMEGASTSGTEQNGRSNIALSTRTPGRDGGGIYFGPWAKGRIKYNTFTNNNAALKGGGLFMKKRTDISGAKQLKINWP